MRNSFYLMAGLVFLLLISCKKEDPNPNIPDVYINITIDPNSTFYQALNTAGGWMYLTADAPSRGIIVHRINNEEFAAFERMPPNDPNKCCDGTSCTRLVVDEFYPFAKDKCNETLYSLLDGSIFTGDGKYGMTRYNCSYYGGLLRIFN